MKPLVFFHKDCADGFGAAFAAWLRFGDDAEYVAIDYDELSNVPVRGDESSSPFYLLDDGTFDSRYTILDREIYILDFGFPKWCTDGLLDVASQLVWLDHHRTAFENWCGAAPPLVDQTALIIGSKLLGGINEDGSRYEEIDDGRHIVLDNGRSGAWLAWEYFHPGKDVPMLIQHIDDQDRWALKLDGTQAFTKVLWSYAPWSFEQWQTWWRDFTPAQGGSRTALKEFIRDGKVILRAHLQHVEDVTENLARPCRIKDPQFDHIEGLWTQWDGIAVNAPAHLVDDVGATLAERGGTFGLVWYQKPDGRVKCSLRSQGDYDVASIAKAYGGGGHLNAAGFTTSMETLLAWLR